MLCLFLPGNAAYRRPAILASHDAVSNSLAVVSDGEGRRAIIRLGRERARVNYAKSAVRRFDNSADIHTTVSAEQEIGRLQAKAIALQMRRIRRLKDDMRDGVRRTQGIVSAAKPTLAGTHRPFRRACGAFVTKANCSAVALAVVADFTHAPARFFAAAKVHTAGLLAPATRRCV